MRSKYDQERLCLLCGRAYRIPTVALRFFNVYGSRHSLSNPYTGVLAIFASRVLNKKRPMVFEDGLQMRDFVSVYDVVSAAVLALESPDASGRVFNVGTGGSCTICEVAIAVTKVLGREELSPEITGKYRQGDIRHCVADVSLAGHVLGYRPRIPFEKGIEELAGWLEAQIATDAVGQARAELETRGLTL